MISHLKNAIRKEVLVKRDALKKAEIREKSERIAENVSTHARFLGAKTVAVYLPIGNEVDTRPIIERATTLGKTVLIPCTDHKITFCEYHSHAELEKGKFGILEPKNKTPHPLEPDLIIVPGVCFGLCMHRIGYGKGHYDKYLKDSNPNAYRIGICFDIQLLEKLPTHEHDVPMDEIVTEKRVIAKKRER